MVALNWEKDGMNMLEVINISKSYGTTKVLDDISIQFEEGKVSSIIGKNGVGKTTFLDIIAGFSCPSSGKVLLDSLPISQLNTRKHIGYMKDSVQLSGKITIDEFLYLISRTKYNGENMDQCNQMMEELQLTEYLGKYYHELSLGNKRKVNMIAAFIGFPKLILLDEPTNGIDSHGLIMLKRYIVKAKENGSIIILSSHILDFVSNISDVHYFLSNNKIEKTEGCKLEEEYERRYIYG